MTLPRQHHTTHNNIKKVPLDCRELPPSEWSIDDDGLDRKRNDGCLPGGTSPRRSSGRYASEPRTASALHRAGPGVLDVSERRACHALDRHHSVGAKVPYGADNEEALTGDIIARARQYRCHDDRRAAARKAA